jgi:PleD family two-component response regulator
MTRGGATLSALLAAADEALYKAKRAGRDQAASTGMAVAG